MNISVKDLEVGMEVEYQVGCGSLIRRARILDTRTWEYTFRGREFTDLKVGEKTFRIGGHQPSRDGVWVPAEPLDAEGSYTMVWPGGITRIISRSHLVKGRWVKAA